MNGFRWPTRRSVAPETPLQLAERLPNLRADPRLVHTSETPEAAGEAGMEGPSQAERAAAMEALRRRVDARRAAPVVPAGPATSVDLGAAVDAAVRKALAERDRAEADAKRRRSAEAARREREEREAAARGGPCQFCGLVLSWQKGDNGERVGRWYDNGKTCAWCELDRANFAGLGGGRSDPEHRIEVLKKHLVPGTEWRGQHLLDRCRGFRWWRDTPGAVGVETPGERFAHVDRAALAATLEPPEQKPVTRDPCGRCGCSHLWLLTHGVQGHGPQQVLTEEWACAGCRGFGSLVEVIGWRIQMPTWVLETLGAGMSRMLGAYWWNEDPSHPRPCTSPFDHIDWNAVRRNAFAVFPNERQWGNVTAWEQAKAAAKA